MIAKRALGAFVLGWLGIAGCGGTSSGGTDPAGNAGIGPGGTDGGVGSCGNQAEHCCTAGALCASGLTCSDEYCLACGPAPVTLKGCTNVTAGAAASAAAAPDAGAPDDPKRVIDNDVCTSWNYGDYGSTGAYWQVDLGTSHVLDALTIWPKMTPADGEVSLLIQYKVAAGDAFINYPIVDGVKLMMHDYQPWQTTLSPPVTARFVRITILSTPSFAALREVGLYSGCTH